MKRNLEDFIAHNREAFDTDEPGPQVWRDIEKKLVPGEKKSAGKTIAFRKWLVAAGMIFAISAGALFLINHNTKLLSTTQPATGSDSQQDILDEINPVYAREVYHFTQLIEIKQNELRQIGKDQPELYSQFMGDITKLDSSYNTLKKELPANPNREQLLEAMIQNLQLQTELLNQQLRIIKQIKQSKTGSHESNSSI
jgi:hypothetical protein